MSTASYSALVSLVRTAGGMAPEQTQVVLHHLMDGSMTPEHGAEVLIAWSERGETGSELATVVEGLLAKSVQVPIAGGMDLCGTGGSGLGRYNVSTTTAFVGQVRLEDTGFKSRKQWVRYNFTPDLNHSGTDIFDASLVAILGGSDSEPTS